MKNFLFFDIDGTLVSHKDRQMPKSAVEAIRRTRELGNIVFLCTGRPKFLQDGVQDLETDGIICSNGAYAERNDRIFMKRPIPVAMVHELIQNCETYRVGCSLHGYSGGWRNEIQKTHMMRMHELMGEAEKKKFMNNAFWLLGNQPIEDYVDQDVFKIDVSFTDESNKEAFDATLNPNLEYVRMMSINRNMRDGGEITRAGVSKGTAAILITEMMGGDVGRTFGFGDSLNDQPLLQLCRTGVAMGNAVEELKKSANYVTTDIDDDGIKNALEHFGLLG